MRREDHKMVALDEQLYVFGGWSGEEYLNDLHRWDLRSLSWTPLSDTTAGLPPSPRAHMGMVAGEGRVFVYGGWTGR
eukprot:3937524-Rhodomonas_salina.1